MKKTVIININGIVFHIDEDAYEKLQAYLDSLSHYFGTTTEGREIVTDIEARIAELLQPKITDNKQSVTVEDINEILAILGSPEDIAASDSSAYETETAGEATYTGKRTSRRLYRDVENSTIGGVCSGLGAYFDIDPMVFRILFIALLFAGGASLVIYIILWIVIPAARTSAQKLEMRGKDINVSNIEKSVREEFNNIKTNMSKPDSVANRLSGFVQELIAFLGVFIRGVFNVLRYIFGAFFILLGIMLSVAIIGALYFKNFAIQGDMNEYFSSAQDFLYNIISPLNADTLLFLAFIILALPIVGLIYLGLKLIIQFEARQKWIVITLSVIWIFAIFSFAVLALKEVENFRSNNQIQEIIPLNTVPKGILYISSPRTNEKEDEFLEFFNHSRLFVPVKDNKPNEFAGIVHIDVEKTTSATPELEIIREARGEDRAEALEFAKAIKVNYTQNDSLITLDPFFRVSNDKRWKFYYTKVIIRLPVGTKIYFDENTRHLLRDIENVNEYWHQQMVNKTWIMTDNGLELLGSNTSEVRPINDFGNKTLNLQLRDRFGIDRDKLYDHNDHDNYGNLMLNGKKYYYGAIDLDVRKSESEQILVELVKTSAGRNSAQADNFLREIEYNYEQNDSVLWLDPVFRFPENSKWNDQRLKVIVRLPINQKVYINRDFEPLIERMASANNKWTGEYINNTWTMKSEGLVKME